MNTALKHSPTLRRSLGTTAAALAMAAVLVGAAGPALADRNDWDHHRGREWHHHGWRDYRFREPRVVYAPPPRVYYAPPPVIYAPPPVVYAPPAVNFVFPFTFR
jgi:hypothetical protein